MSIIKANTFQDRGGNTILSSDGSGNVTAGSSLASSVASVGSLANTPAFEAYLSSDQNISNGVFAKVQFNTETYDTNGCYDNATNYRFTPTVAGKYLIYASITFRVGDYVAYGFQLNIRRNGGDYAVARVTQQNNTLYEDSLHVSTTMSFDGSTDYAEVYGYSERHGGADTQLFVAANRRTVFGACRIIGA